MTKKFWDVSETVNSSMESEVMQSFKKYFEQVDIEVNTLDPLGEQLLK